MRRAFAGLPGLERGQGIDHNRIYIFRHGLAQKFRVFCRKHAGFVIAEQGGGGCRLAEAARRAEENDAALSPTL